MGLIMDYLSNAVLQIMGIGIAAACGWLAAQVKRLSTRDAALYAGMKAVLRKELVDDFEKYVVNGSDHQLTIERKREIEECYAAYAALGGNGVGKQMYEKLCEVKIDVVQ